MSIKFGRITDEWRVVIADSDDPGREPDVVAADVVATFTPHVDMVQKVRSRVGERWWTMVLMPLEAIYVDGKLVGEDGEDGMELVSEVDGQPVFWEIRRVASYGESRWEPETVTVRPTPGESVHLPTLAPVREEDMPQLEAVYVDIASVTEARNRVDNVLSAVRATASSAATNAGLARDNSAKAETAKTAAEAAKTAAEQAKTAAENAKTAAERATSGKADKSHTHVLADIKGTSGSALTVKGDVAGIDFNQTGSTIPVRTRAGELTGNTGTHPKHLVNNESLDARLAPGNQDAPVNSYAAGKARTIVSRIKDGQIAVNDPTDSWSATNKKYVDAHTWPLTKLEQHAADGTMTSDGVIRGFAWKPTPQMIAVRRHDGTIRCADPLTNEDAATKKYVDGKTNGDIDAALTPGKNITDRVNTFARGKAGTLVARHADGAIAVNTPPEHTWAATSKAYVDTKVSADVGAARAYVDGKLSSRPSWRDIARGIRMWDKNGMCMLRISHGNRRELEELLKTAVVPEGLRPAWSALGPILHGGTLSVGADGVIKIEGNDLHSNGSIYGQVTWLAWA